MTKSVIDDLKVPTIQFLQDITIAVGVGAVARHLGCSWTSARQVLMELLVEGIIECEQTSNARIFRLKRIGR